MAHISYINEIWHSYTLSKEHPTNSPSLNSADISIFSSEIDKIIMVTILIMSAKMATLATLVFLNIKMFWNKVYDVITSVHNVTNKILLLDTNYIVDSGMWPKFGNSSISMREVNITSILQLLAKKFTCWYFE